VNILVNRGENMKNLKGIIVIVVSFLCGLGGILLKSTPMERYTILTFTLAGVFFIVGVVLLIRNSSPNRIYESSVNAILNTYDSVLVKSNTPPNLEDRNIVTVMSIDDLIDAQMEIRKPICYLKQTESCSFVLLDDKEAYVYIEKLNEDVVSPLEIAIKECKIKNRNKEEMDSEMLRDIEKTTVVKLSNQKSYKVSPIRKKKQQEVKEEEKEEKKIIEENPLVEEKKEENSVVEEKQEEKKEKEVSPVVEEKKEEEKKTIVEEEII